jgi:hypothetical protein
MRIRRRSALIFALVAGGALIVAAVAMATTSSFTFSFSPSKVPKKTYKAGALSSNLVTKYTVPGNNVPGGAVERTQLFLDQNWKINPKAAAKCSTQQLAGKTMKGAMKVCGKAKVGSGTATANANGAFIIKGCVLLFNGQPKGGKPTLQVFTRIQGSNPSIISCANPASNTQGNGTVLLTGVLKDASAPYGKVLDVNHITQSASFPLEVFNTVIKKGNYISARCKAANKTWNMKVIWTYNNNAKRIVKRTQPCQVG